MQHLVGFLGELEAVGCDLYLHQQALDTTTPSGRAMFHMCGVFAEFERAMIRERTRQTLAAAKARGTNRKGKPLVLGNPKQAKQNKADALARAQALRPHIERCPHIEQRHRDRSQRARHRDPER